MPGRRRTGPCRHQIDDRRRPYARRGRSHAARRPLRTGARQSTPGSTSCWKSRPPRRLSEHRRPCCAGGRKGGRFATCSRGALQRPAAPNAARITWKEDIRRWHPGQGAPRLAAGGFGVFDPASTRFPSGSASSPSLGSAWMEVPQERASPLPPDLIPHAAAMLPANRPQTWDIEVDTDRRHARLRWAAALMDPAHRIYMRRTGNIRAPFLAAASPTAPCRRITPFCSTMLLPRVPAAAAARPPSRAARAAAPGGLRGGPAGAGAGGRGTLPGGLTPHQVSEIRPQVAGLDPQALLHRRRDRPPGQTLYQIDPSLYQAGVAEGARPSLQNARGQRRGRARSSADRYKPRSADAEAVSASRTIPTPRRRRARPSAQVAQTKAQLRHRADQPALHRAFPRRSPAASAAR